MDKKIIEPTICAILRGIRNKVNAHMANRGKDLKLETLSEIDRAISMAKKMNERLIYYKKKEEKNG
jgi:hypothetical protein